MDSVSTHFARNFLRFVKLDAATRNPVSSILEVLTEHVLTSAKTMTRNGGMALIQQAGNGHSYQLIQSSGFSPTQYAEMIDELLTRYETSSAALISEGNPTPTDQQIFDDMMGYLKPVYETQSDFRGMHYQPGVFA